jgi:hypothetical protein
MSKPEMDDLIGELLCRLQDDEETIWNDIKQYDKDAADDFDRYFNKMLGIVSKVYEE